MSVPIAIYIACLLGAVAISLLLPRHSDGQSRHGAWKALGWIFGAGGLGIVWLSMAPQLWRQGSGIEDQAMLFYFVFSVIAIASAVRVITHPRPVYSALWFVMVVLASAGLFVVLSAEFMALAMVIIYGGAILVTYMFVLMLASQSAEDDDQDEQPTYDRVAHEPALATAAGFVMLAVVASVVTEPMSRNVDAQQTDASFAALLPERHVHAGEVAIIEELETDSVADAEASVAVLESEIDEASTVTNLEKVGIDLFRGHPLAIELAGIVLLVSLIGAVMIAKRRVEEEDAELSRSQGDQAA